MITLQTLKSFVQIEPCSNKDYRCLPQKINQVGDRFWLIEKTSAVELRRIAIIDWGVFYNKLPKHLVIVAQEAALKSVNGHTNPDTGRLALTTQAACYALKGPCNLLALIKQHYPDVSIWKALKVQDLTACVVEELKALRQREKQKGCFTASTGRSVFLSLLKSLRLFGNEARNISPFTAALATDIPSSPVVLKSFLAEEGITFAEFSNQNNTQLRETIPVNLANLWLAFIVNELTSIEFKIWQAHWVFLRRYTNHHGLKNFAAKGSWRSLVNTYYKYRDNPESLTNKVQRQAIIYLATTYTEVMTEIVGYVPSKQLVTNVTDVRKPNSRLLETSKYIKHLYALIAITSGGRRSELVNLKLSDFQEETDQVSQFTSYIHKTNSGLPTIRCIAGFVHEFVNCCANLGEIDRRNKGVNLFYVRAGNSVSRSDTGRKAAFFDGSYQLFLQSLPTDLAREIRNQYPSVSSHQARHLFAAFALRVSDGNVFEAIRKHFRHQLGSPMTRAYTNYKISIQEAKAYEKDYIKEILNRIGNKESHGYFGPMISRIEQFIDENIEFWDVADMEELNHQIETLADQFHAVKVHEWGLCLTLKKTLASSKCYNKSTKLPDYNKGSTFNNCASCIHLLSQEACKEDIERIGIFAAQTLEHHPLLGVRVRKELENTIHQVVNLLKQLETQREK